MKKYVRILGIMFAAAFVFAACDSSGGDDSPLVNDVAAGVMTEETAAEIFNYNPDGSGVKINKLKNVDALKGYMDTASKAPKQSASLGPNRVSGGGSVFFLNKIGNLFVVNIGAGAFTPGNNEKKLADIGITSFKLPEKLAEIAPEAFMGQAVALALIIPETVAAVVVTAVETAANKANLPEPTKDDGVPKSIKITDIPANIKTANTGLYIPPNTNIAAIIFNGEGNVSSDVLEEELYFFDSEGNQIQIHKPFTLTGSYNVFFEDKTNSKAYTSKEKITIKDALTTVSFTDLEEFIE